MFHGSGKNVQILHKQARGATRTDQNAISELCRTPLLSSGAQELEPAMVQQIVKVSAYSMINNAGI